MNKREEYEAYLHSKQWKQKRQEIAERRNFTCEICGQKTLNNFHIHHKTYIHFGAERDNELKFLCENCHENLHKMVRQKQIMAFKRKLANKNKQKPFKIGASSQQNKPRDKTLTKRV